MRRFELSEGTSNKFWQVEVEGTDLHIAWGKLGTAGQSQTKSFGSGAAAQSAADKLIAEKTKKGYGEVGAPEAAVKTEAEAAADKPKPKPKAAKPKAEPVAAVAAPVEAAAPTQSPVTGGDMGPALEERVAKGEDEDDSPGAPEPLPTEAYCLAEIASSAVEKSYSDHTPKGELKAGLKHSNGKYREYAERILATYAEGKAPPTLDADGDAALLYFAPQHVSVPYLLSRGGLAYAVKVLVRSAYLQQGSVGGQGGSYRYFEPNQPSLQGYALVYAIGGVLRMWKSQFSAADIAAARVEAAKHRQEPLPIRIGLALALDDAEWMAEDTQAVLAMKKNEYYYGIPSSLFSGLADIELTNQLAARHPGDVPVDDLIARFGLGAAKAVITSLDAKNAWAVERVVRLETVAMAKALVDALPHKKSAEIAKAYYERRPDLAIVALAPIVARGEKAATYAKPVLEAIVRKNPGLPEKLAAHLEPKARALFTASASSPAAPEAASSELPKVLTTPLAPPKKGKVPSLPGFVDLASMPKVLLVDKKKALPLSAVTTLVAILQRSTLAEPHSALAEVKAACDAPSLALFAWSLFEGWLASGIGSKENWAFTALGLLGDDEAARRLTPLIRAWPGESQHARAAVGLDILAGIGTDLALMNLHGVAEKVKFKALQEKAKEKIAFIASARGLTSEELADRLVPDLGLDEDGSMVLDFGSRVFKVAFDESLKPVARDESGKVLTDLPKPNKSDDAEKSAEATERWKNLKKDARAIASSQLLRLELGMCRQRRWKRADFETFMLRHPLVLHLARRLVWGVFESAKPEASLQASFRVAEDGTFANEKDEAVKLPKDAVIGLLHRLEMTDALLAKWGSVLAEYEVLQPFDQLGRQVYTATAAEKKAEALTRLKDVEVKSGKVLGLESRGWRKGEAQDAGWVWDMWKSLPGGLELSMGLGGGFCMGAADMNPPTQKLDAVAICKVGGTKATFGALSATAFSELVRELENLRD